MKAKIFLTLLTALIYATNVSSSLGEPNPNWYTRNWRHATIPFFEHNGLFYEYNIEGSDTLGVLVADGRTLDNQLGIFMSPYSGEIVIPKSIDYNGKNYKVLGVSLNYSKSVDSIILPEDYEFPNGVFAELSGAKKIPNRTAVKYDSNGKSTKLEIFDHKGCFQLTSFTPIDPSTGKIDFYDENDYYSYTNKKDYGYSDKRGIKLSLNFQGCCNLQYVKLPYFKSTKDIKYAFRGCISLEQLDIPETITEIALDLSYNPIKKIYCRGVTPPHISYLQFKSDEIYSTATVYVPNGSLATYKAAEGWKNFTNIVEGFPEIEMPTELKIPIVRTISEAIELGKSEADRMLYVGPLKMQWFTDTPGEPYHYGDLYVLSSEGETALIKDFQYHYNYVPYFWQNRFGLDMILLKYGEDDNGFPYFTPADEKDNLCESYVFNPRTVFWRYEPCEIATWSVTDHKCYRFVKLKEVDFYNSDTEDLGYAEDIRGKAIIRNNFKGIFNEYTNDFVGDLPEDGKYDIYGIVMPVANGEYELYPTHFEKYDGNDITEVSLTNDYSDAEYYNLSGLKMNPENLGKGIYIRVCNGKAEKIIK